MQFQTENVLNSIDNVKKAADIGMTAGTGFILRNGMFYNVNNIVNKAVKKTAATSGVLEKWTVAMPDVTYYSGKLFRFLLDVRLKGDVRSDYDRYSVYKGKPFYFSGSRESKQLLDPVRQAFEVVRENKKQAGTESNPINFSNIVNGLEGISLAGYIKDGKFVEEKKVNILINPKSPIPYAASQVHHIYDIDVKNAPFIENLIEEIISYINDPDIII